MKSMMEQPLYDAYTASMPNQTAYVASTTEGLAVLLIQGLFGFCLVVYGCQQKRWN
jgi:hypothetical protein